MFKFLSLVSVLVVVESSYLAGHGTSAISSYGSISGGSSLGNGGNGAGHALVALPTAFSTQSRFDIIHPGSIIRQTVSQVPVVSTQIRPVAFAVGHGYGAHH